MVKRIINSISLNNFSALLGYILVAIGCGLITWYSYEYYTTVPKTKKNLWSILQTTENNIHDYLRKQEDHLTQLATDKKTIALFKRNNEALGKKYATFIEQQQEEMDFKNIVIFDTNQNIIFSTIEELQKTTQAVSEKYINSPLTLSYERAMMTLSTDFAQFNIDPFLKRPALFITTPVMYNNKLLGVMAYEYNAQDIYRLTNQYIGLGTTGEIALAQKDGQFIIFVAPTRHAPDLAFQKREILGKNAIAVQASILGGQGVGRAVDYRKQPVVAAWTYLPKLGCGLIVKMDQSEVFAHLKNLEYGLIFFFLIFALYVVYRSTSRQTLIAQLIQRMKERKSFAFVPVLLRNKYPVSIIICSLFLINAIGSYYYQNRYSIKVSQSDIMSGTQKNAERIDQILKKLSFTIQSIADDLHFNRLSHEDIEKRLKRDVSENENIISITVAFEPYAYDNQTRLYGISIDKSYKITNIATLYDYTDTEEYARQGGWYQKCVTSDSVWLNPYTDSSNKRIPPTYSHTFYDKDKKPLGVVSVAYSMTNITQITEYNSLNQIGYSLLIANNGQLLSHPVSSRILEEKTLLDLAEENGNDTLAKLIPQILSKESVLASYKSPDTQQQMWIYTHQIETNHWILGTIFPTEDIAIQPQAKRVYLFWILMYALLCSLLIAGLLRKKEYISPLQTMFLVNALLLFGLIYTWRVIQSTSIINKRDSTVITDQASLDKFLDDLREEAKRKNETPPILVPTGLLLYAIDVSGTNDMVISGYMWNRYSNEDYNLISHKMKLPHAIRLYREKPTTATDKEGTTVTWNFRATIYQRQNYTHFPFDKQQLQITLEHSDIEKNILLIPDLSAYKKISPEDTPGLSKNFTLSRKRIEQTFFHYKKLEPTSTFGFKNYGKSTDNYQLIYNIVTTRGLLNPFILFVLPLLVVLFSLFSILIASRRESDPLTLIASYTGLFFALILLQRSLREAHPTSVTMYIEYAFFFTYITIILLVIHTTLTYLYPQWKYYQERVFPLVKILFWPFQILCWLITTLIVFY